MVAHTQKGGGPTCGRKPRDSAHPPPSVCFWHLPLLTTTTTTSNFYFYYYHYY